jgi:Tfp pilus assembly protein PilF
MRVVARIALLGVGLCVSGTVGAQQPRRTTRSSSGSIAVRAELATVLLQSGRYDEAAREFRALLARDPNNFEYRLGLAHALAWGDKPRDAERELVQLIAKRPNAPGLDSLLRSVRDAYDPRAVDAAQWVAKEPTYAPYRVTLARALAREHLFSLAIAHYDTLLTRPGVGRVPDRGTLLREMADVYVSAGDRARGAERLRLALADAPADTALRHALATMLADSRSLDAARAQYDTLIQLSPSAALLRERAQLRLSSGDRAGAESDLWASVRLEPTGDAYLLLGDLYRERGDYRGARSMYVAARQGAPASVRLAVSGALSQLDREERPAVLAPLVGDDPGWRLTEDASADNLGVAYSALALRRSVAVAAATRLSLGAEWRQLAERTAARRVDATGVGANVGGGQEVAYGPALARLELQGGAVYHELGGTLGVARGALALWLYAWQLDFELSREPAYASLFSAEALVPLDGSRPLVERDAAVTLGGPVGPLDVGFGVQRSLLSDGNSRLTIDSYLRYPLGGNLYALYSGTGLGFAQRSTVYWDPSRYTAQAAGVEYSVRRARGLSFGVRAMPSFATSDEAPIVPASEFGDPAFTRGPMTRRSALQLGASADLGYRLHGWEAAGAVSYGRGRAGDYQRVGASITIRMAP